MDGARCRIPCRQIRERAGDYCTFRRRDGHFLPGAHSAQRGITRGKWTRVARNQIQAGPFAPQSLAYFHDRERQIGHRVRVAKGFSRTGTPLRANLRASALNMEIPFTKLQGDENDFILTWGDEVPESDFAAIARRICARTTGIGADGWMLVWPEANGLRTRLFNSDGSEPEISGNGTRCAAAFGLWYKAVLPPQVTVTTAAGRKNLRLLSRCNLNFLFEMDMGSPRLEELNTRINLAGRDFDATILDVGN